MANRTESGSRRSIGRTLLIFLGILALLFALIGLLKNRQADVAISDINNGQNRKQVQQFWEYYKLATRDRIAGRMDLAARNYELALEIDAHHANSLYYLGNIYLHQGQFTLARTVWEKLLTINPNSARAHSRLGDMFLCLSPDSLFNLERAEREFLQAHEVNRVETGPLIKLGQVALLRGDFDSALSLFDAVTRTNAASIEAHFFEGFIAWKRDSLPLATALFARAVGPATAPNQLPGGSREGDTKSGNAPTLGENEW
ncbi:MAG: tetratricopeptide repeat protein, partial [Gemmatimonadales bacterium]